MKRVVMKIFIADDSVLFRERLITMLTDLPGIEIVGEAGSATEAIDSIGKLRPDVVILDIRMPGNGIKVLENIKKGTAAPMVIMLTNYPYLQYRKKCMAAGANFFLDKSNEFEKLPEILKQISQDIHT